MRRDRSAGGRGVGLPPLFMQAESAARLGLASGSEMLYGGRTSRDLVLLGEMRALGIPLHLATEDGSLGRRGRVTDELEARLEHWRAAASTRRLRIMACGPRAMLWAVGRIAQSCDIECYLSLEEADGLRHRRVSGLRSGGGDAPVSLRVQGWSGLSCL